MLNAIKKLYLFINIVIITALLLLHFVVKDSSYHVSLWFYAFPLPIICVVIVLLSFFLGKTFKVFNWFIALALLCVWLVRSYRITLPNASLENSTEIVFWNVSHDKNFKDAFNENNTIPDIAVLVEHDTTSFLEVEKTYPDYYFYKHPKAGIGIFSKTPIHIINTFSSNYKTTVVNFESKDINFYAVDVSASIDVPRAWEIGFVSKVIPKNKNTVILGDFNVPYESILLDTIKENYNHAFTEKGTGFRETWFWNIPLLSLDHIWVSKDLQIEKIDKINTFKSDHIMLRMFLVKQ